MSLKPPFTGCWSPRGVKLVFTVKDVVTLFLRSCELDRSGVVSYAAAAAEATVRMLLGWIGYGGILFGGVVVCTSCAYSLCSARSLDFFDCCLVFGTGF